MAFVALPCYAFCRDIGLAVAADRLQQVVLVEANALLQRVVACDFDIGLTPEGIEVLPLLRDQGVEACRARLRQCAARQAGQLLLRIIAQ